MSNLKTLFKQNAFWMVNKKLVSLLGLEDAIVLTVLFDKFVYHQERGETILRDGKEWFFYTSESMKQAFRISYKIQKRILEKLEKAGFIKQLPFGVPCRLHFTIFESQLLQILNDSFDEKSLPVFTKGEYLNFEKDITIYKNKEEEQNDNSLSKLNEALPNGNGQIEAFPSEPKQPIKKTEEEKKRRARVNFVVPDKKEVAAYFKEKDQPDEAAKFYNFYDSKNWMVGKTKMTNWKAAANGWVLRNKKPEDVSGSIVLK